MSIRQYRSGDKPALRMCVIQLQDAERKIHPHTADGETIAQPYIDQLLEKCSGKDGRILVAEEDGSVVGYAAVQASVSADEIHELPYEYAYICDLVILDGHRRRGLGRALLEAAESYARARGAELLRVGALAKNSAARNLYERYGFHEQEIVFEKRLR